MCLFRKTPKKVVIFSDKHSEDKIETDGHGVKGTLGLLNIKGAIPLFLLIYSFNKYLFCPFYVPGTAGKESFNVGAKGSTK